MNLSCWFGDHNTCHLPVLILDSSSKKWGWMCHVVTNKAIHVSFKEKITILGHRRPHKFNVFPEARKRSERKRKWNEQSMQLVQRFPHITWPSRIASLVEKKNWNITAKKKTFSSSLNSNSVYSLKWDLQQRKNWRIWVLTWRRFKKNFSTNGLGNLFEKRVWRIKRTKKTCWLKEKVHLFVYDEGWSRIYFLKQNLIFLFISNLKRRWSIWKRPSINITFRAKRI